MQLPVNPPVLPMLAKRVDTLPDGDGWIYEPKWDGFRVLVFRDGDDVVLQSRDRKTLNRYFPELEEPLRKQVPRRCSLDGEIVIVRTQGWTSMRFRCASIPRPLASRCSPGRFPLRSCSGTSFC